VTRGAGWTTGGAATGGAATGGACWAAVRLAQELSEGCIVFIACDRGDRYLSSDLFAAG